MQKEKPNSAGIEAAHLKTIGLWEGFFGVSNLISSENAPELSLASNCKVQALDLIVNARVACDPVELQQIVESTVNQVILAAGATGEFRRTQSFKPGRPVPTHRLSSSISEE